MRVTGVLLFSFALFVGLLMIYHQGDGPIISQAQGPEMASKFECPDDPEAYLYDMLPAPQPDQSPAETYNAFNRTIVQPFLDNRCYAAWKRDKGVRDTGPFIDKQAYNTHSAVIIYYSPLTFKWL